MVTFSGVQPPLHNNCHHQKAFAHINILIEYPQPYHRLIWDYSNVDILNIRECISSIKCIHLFSDNHIDIQVSIFEVCVLNLFRNFVPNKYVVFDDKEPVWMDQAIKQLIKERDSFFLKISESRLQGLGFAYCYKLMDMINEHISSNRKSFF